MPVHDLIIICVSIRRCFVYCRQRISKSSLKGFWQIMRSCLSCLLFPFELDSAKVPPMLKKFTHVYDRNKEYLYVVKQCFPTIIWPVTQNRTCRRCVVTPSPPSITHEQQYFFHRNAHLFLEPVSQNDSRCFCLSLKHTGTQFCCPLPVLFCQNFNNIMIWNASSSNSAYWCTRQSTAWHNVISTN